MRRCLQLATKGLGRTRPNPLVGCVIVSPSGDIISEGYHQQYGMSHAERNAILRYIQLPEAKPDILHNATLYVNLEPCSHHGNTPPCADLIVQHGIRRVVCCNDDPNPLVAGAGFAKLKAAGIEVIQHVLEPQGRYLNRRFFTFMEQHRPYIILKWAESANGFMAPLTTKPYWITTPRQDQLNHLWRTQEAAILIGSETYLADNPKLTARHCYGNSPQPIVLDRRQRITSLPSNWIHLTCDNLNQVMQHLYEARLQSVIVEGGKKILEAFISQGLYDEVRILIGPDSFDTGIPAPTKPTNAIIYHAC
ncbi:MAG: bifunctional diaminohydroxyphosphoribosylaminopyrimidine deaminase/5-amino-6-(5-phosphoribosylamino)uracil reductase RibD [Bacteroidales bacterium]|nr:bifunctional diaminohydroxyphosphoribosylaminopyrimidine deaminase/5-amino-6-(5-phosphoribosylamino)uracil reductase RibD [Candidatus Colimorpha onthohippi]